MTELEQKAVEWILADRKAFSTIKEGHSIAIRDTVVVIGRMESGQTLVQSNYTSVRITAEMLRAVCLHNHFRIEAAVGRIMSTQGEKKEADEFTPADYFHADIKLICHECGQTFEWQGLPNGYSPYQPTVSIDGQTMGAPAMPAGKSVPPGMIGFRVTHTTLDQAEKETVKQ